MTLIITGLADDAIIQVSDRRLSSNGVPVDDDANKALCVECQDAAFTVAYTGTAGIWGYRTDRWLFDLLTEMKANERSFPQIVEDLLLKLETVFVALGGEPKPLMVVMAGFGPPGPFQAVFSNFEQLGDQVIVNTKFESHYSFRNQRVMTQLDMTIHGFLPAITDEIRAAIVAVRKQAFGLPPIDRVSLIVDILQSVARGKAVMHAIGEDCMSVIVPAAGPIETRFHPSGASTFSYAPHYLGGAFAFRDVRFSAPPGWSIRLGGGAEE